MHQFTRGLEKRLAAVERRLGAVPTIETDAIRDRRRVLVMAAHAGNVPGDLEPEERPVFSRIVATVPIALELQQDGLIDGYGEPSVVDDYPHETEDGRPVWSP